MTDVATFNVFDVEVGLFLDFWSIKFKKFFLHSTKGHSKGTRALQNILQSLSLNPPNQNEEDVEKISFNKS